MCTMIAHKIEVDGSGKGKDDWFPLCQATVTYDHPFHASLEHALNIDFTNPDRGLGARVSVELSAAAARALVLAIEQVLAQADRGGHIIEERPTGLIAPPDATPPLPAHKEG